MLLAIRELANGPDVAGSRARVEISSGLRTLHVARHGRRGRHFLLYRVVGQQAIEVGRIPHDAMELRRHVAFPSDKGNDQ
jgi:toxin ParE1/3/4